MPSSPPSRRTLRVAVVVGVVAFALGAAGTATAGPALTAGAVKKIAAKVVKKSAPKLSVAHAASADTATNATTAAHATTADTLGGNTSADLQTRVYSFNIPEFTAVATLRKVALHGVPPGKYLVTYTVRGVLTPNTDYATCYVSSAFSGGGDDTATQYSTHPSAAIGFGVSGSGTMTVGSTVPTLICNTGSIPTTIELTSGTVTLERVDDLVSANGTTS